MGSGESVHFKQKLLNPNAWLWVLSFCISNIALMPSAQAGLTEDELQFEKDHPLSSSEYNYEQKAFEIYDPKAPYAMPDEPSPAMADLLDRIFSTYKSRDDFEYDQYAFNTWSNRIQQVVSEFDQSTDNYIAMQKRMIGETRKACNYTVFVAHGATRDESWLEGKKGTRLHMDTKAADYDDHVQIDHDHPRDLTNVFNGVPFVGRSSSFLSVMKVEFIDGLIQYMNFKHLNFLPLYFVVNRESVKAGHPGHVFMITGLKRTGSSTGRTGFTFQMREGSLDEVYWRARTRDARVDVFLNSPMRFNLNVPLQAFATFYELEMDTRFTIRENQQRKASASASQSSSNTSADFQSWFAPLLK